MLMGGAEVVTIELKLVEPSESLEKEQSIFRNRWGRRFRVEAEGSTVEGGATERGDKASAGPLAVDLDNSEDEDPTRKARLVGRKRRVLTLSVLAVVHTLGSRYFSPSPLHGTAALGSVS